MSEPSVVSRFRARVRTFGRYVRTVRYLRSAQIYHRIRLRGLRIFERRFPSQLIRPIPLNNFELPGWPSSFTPLGQQMFRDDLHDPAQGSFTFLNETRSLGTPMDWNQLEASQLWRFNLHYFEWAWQLVRQDDRAAARETFSGLWKSWASDSPIGRGDAWSPYVVSLRSWVLCAIFGDLIAGTPIEAEVLESLRVHAGFLKSHLELDVGGNHLIKNLKALIALGIFFDVDPLFDLGWTHLNTQINTQVLADGGHYERSPAYHCQVLADLIDIRTLTVGSEIGESDGLRDTIAKMRLWLGHMLAPDNSLPQFNDCWDMPATEILLLDPIKSENQGVIVLHESGFAILRTGAAFLVADFGDPCPDDLPAHAHADCLSFQLWVDDQKVIHDPGTSTYEAGPRRQLERSTASHNTFCIDGIDQTEVWGQFRAGARARGRLEYVSIRDAAIEFCGSHNGYTQLQQPVRIQRTWMLSPKGLQIRDEFLGIGTHQVSNLWITEDKIKLTEVVSNSAIQFTTTDFDRGTAFGQYDCSSAIKITAGNANFPFKLVSEFTWSYELPQKK